MTYCNSCKNQDKNACQDCIRVEELIDENGNVEGEEYSYQNYKPKGE